LHWNANTAGRGGSRGQSEQVNNEPIHPPNSPPPPPPPDDVEDNPFRPSKDLRVEDESAKEEGSPTSTTGDRQSSGPPASSTASDSQDKGNKFSFAFKTKQGPPPGPKPDLAQKMRESAGRRESGEDGKSSLASRYGVNGKPSKPREPRMVERIKRRIKPKPYLPQEFVESDSVYFRKPGNESVVGSGTYGKVFKAIHVYTNQLVALKKIRMEGERDGVSRRFLFSA
jgi:CTD kinase subunit alpha